MNRPRYHGDRRCAELHVHAFASHTRDTDCPREVIRVCELEAFRGIGRIRERARPLYRRRSREGAAPAVVLRQSRIGRAAVFEIFENPPGSGRASTEVAAYAVPLDLRVRASPELREESPGITGGRVALVVALDYDRARPKRIGQNKVSSSRGRADAVVHERAVALHDAGELRRARDDRLARARRRDVLRRDVVAGERKRLAVRHVERDAIDVHGDIDVKRRVLVHVDDDSVVRREKRGKRLVPRKRGERLRSSVADSRRICRRDVFDNLDGRDAAAARLAAGLVAMAGDGHGGAGHDVRDEVVHAFAKTERIVGSAGRAPFLAALDRGIRNARVVNPVDRHVAELEVVVVCRMVSHDAVELVGNVRHVHNHGQSAIVEIPMPDILRTAEVAAPVCPGSLGYLHGRAAKRGSAVVCGGHVVP